MENQQKSKFEQNVETEIQDNWEQIQALLEAQKQTNVFTAETGLLETLQALAETKGDFTSKKEYELLQMLNVICGRRVQFFEHLQELTEGYAYYQQHQGKTKSKLSKKEQRQLKMQKDAYNDWYAEEVRSQLQETLQKEQTEKSTMAEFRPEEMEKIDTFLPKVIIDTTNALLKALDKNNMLDLLEETLFQFTIETTKLYFYIFEDQHDFSKIKDSPYGVQIEKDILNLFSRADDLLIDDLHPIF